jgi:hypothetical protein
MSRPIAWGRRLPALLIVAALLVYVPQLRAEDPAAKVLTLTGQVSVLKDNFPWALDVGTTVQPKQIIIAGPNSFAEFQVSDGSRFEVFPNSRVMFRPNVGNWHDLMDVLIGRVKVHIQKLTGGQPNPNNVRTPTAVISVRGTVFDVAIEDDDDTTFVSVEEGEVEVWHLGQKKSLHPGEWVRVYKNQPLAKTVDKGAVVQGAMRAAAQAMYQLIYRTPRVGGPTGGGIPTGTNGDRDKGAPPEAPPPSAPPPPPPPQ